MAEPGMTGAPDDTGAHTGLGPVLEDLRAGGAAERDPVRFAYLEAMARRAALQPESIRRVLDHRIDIAAAELANCALRTAPPENKEVTASPLGELLAYISRQSHEPSLAVPPLSAGSPVRSHARSGAPSPSATRTPQGPELKSVAYFRNTWSKLSTEQQLTQTLAQAPDNAGPMNSQHLVLRSLQLMRDIAPDYLQGFMSYIDTLIWLDHVDPTKPVASRSAGGEGESKKTRAPKRSASKGQSGGTQK